MRVHVTISSVANPCTSIVENNMAVCTLNSSQAIV